MSASVAARRFGVGRRARARTACARSSASERSRNASSGSASHSSAISVTVRSRYRSCSGRSTVSTRSTCQTNTNERPRGSAISVRICVAQLADRASAAIAPVPGGSACRGTTASRRTGTSCRARSARPGGWLANIGWIVEPFARAARARTRGCALHPSGACGSSVSVLRCTGRPDARASARIEGAVVVVVAGEERARDELDRAAAELAQDRMRARSARRAAAWLLGTPRPSCATCSSSWLDVKPYAPCRNASRTSSCICDDLVGGRGAFGRVVAHHDTGGPRSARRSRRRSRRAGRRGRRGSRASVPPRERRRRLRARRPTCLRRG